MSEEFADEDRGAVSALHQAVRAEEWTHLAGTGADARSRSHRMRRTRYAATAGTAVAVTGVAVLVASTFGGGGTPEAAAPAGGATHSSSAPGAPHLPAKTLTQPDQTTQPTHTTPAAPATSAGSQRTMASYYDKWKTCPADKLAVGANPPGVTLPPTSSKVWLDACRRIVGALTALHPDADVSPAPSSWHVTNVHDAPPVNSPGREEPVPADAVPDFGPSMYRIQDAKGTLVLAFHSADAQSHDDPPDGGTQVDMIDGLHAWLLPPKVAASGRLGLGEFFVQGAKKQDSYVLLMQAPAGYTAEDFQALVTGPAFKQLMADNLKEPNF